jgi:hypothetical protein
LTAIVCWGVTFASFQALLPARAREARTPVVWLVVAALSVGGYRTMAASPAMFSQVFAGATADVSTTLEHYAGYDASFRLIRDVLAPPTVMGEDAGVFYDYLQKNTNIPRTVKIQPLDVALVSSLQAAPGPKPNIFIFVIDSLRQDYVSAYNPQVTFTPSLGRFAADSTVFRNAFTHYGATGLSEPSIWVGGLMPHQQYISPFGPMNSLQKLI